MSFFFKKYNIKDLEEINTLIGINRENYRIAIIDDQNIQLIKILRQHSYRIDYFKDIAKLDDLAKFDIIVCDIEGVGKSFGSKFQGGHLIKEIRNQYPLKYIIAFSGKSFDIRYNEYFKLCDDVKEKYTDITNWTQCLDLGISNINNPVYIWNKARELLVKNRIDMNVISKIEKNYIKSMIKKDINYFTKLKTKKVDFGNSVVIIDAIGTYIQVLLGILQLSK